MAAAKKTASSSSFLRRARKKRKGVHAKRGTSKTKTSKRYKKKYNGQGK